MKLTQHYDNAATALDAYQTVCGRYAHADERSTLVADLIGDLLHWCDVEGVDGSMAIEKAQEMYEGDKTEPDFEDGDEPEEPPQTIRDAVAADLGGTL